MNGLNDDARWLKIHEDSIGLVLAVIRNDLEGFGHLIEPYKKRPPEIGPLAWDMAFLAQSLAKRALEMSFEQHPQQPPMSLEDFFQAFAFRLKGPIPPPPPD